jgi:hypothetical protein
MYDYPELRPRMAALNAGARLGDPRATPSLIELAHKAPAATRVEALRLLANMPGDARINLAMREIVNDPNLDIRVAAYEGLRKRNDAMLVRIPISESASLAPRFTLELLPATEPMVYVTQQGEPRLVIFGGVDATPGAATASKFNGIRIRKPALLSVWDDRFMLSAQGATSELRVRYRDPRTNQVTQTKCPEDIGEFVEFLAHKPTPEDPRPGLGMTYSQVVGVVYAMCPKANEPVGGGADPRATSALAATFATEEDRLRAEIFEAAQATLLADRPENEAEAVKQADTVFRPTAPTALPSAGGQADDGDMKSKIVPLKKPAKK